MEPIDQYPTKRELIDSALRFWEFRRIGYNAFLSAVVVISMVVYREHFAHWFTLLTFMRLFMLAVMANFLYCFAYLVDIPVQYSSYRQQWLGKRWILWMIGMLFAATIASQFMADLLVPYTQD